MPKYQKILEMSDEEFNKYISKSYKSVCRIVITSQILASAIYFILSLLDISKDLLLGILYFILFIGYIAYEIKKDEKNSMYIYLRSSKQSIITKYEEQIETYKNIIEKKIINKK